MPAANARPNPSTPALERVPRQLSVPFGRAFIAAVESEASRWLSRADDRELEAACAKPAAMSARAEWLVLGSVLRSHSCAAWTGGVFVRGEESTACSLSCEACEPIVRSLDGPEGTEVMASLASAHQTVLGRVTRIDPVARALRLLPARDSQRRRLGAFYTPLPIVQHLLDIALEPVLDQACSSQDPVASLRAIRVCDPACGDGRFLLAAGLRIAERLAVLEPGSPGLPRMPQTMERVCKDCLFGVDLDPIAVELAVASVCLACGPAANPALADSLRMHLRTGDALLGAPHDDPSLRDPTSADGWCHARLGTGDRRPLFHWGIEFASVFADRAGFDVVVGNPPFLNQLRTSTTTDRAWAMLVRERLGEDLGSYTDTSAAFMLLAAKLARPGGRACLIQPQSLLAARDARPVRSALLAMGSLESLWVSGGQPFAGVGTRVCAPSVRIGSSNSTALARSFGEKFEPMRPVRITRTALRTSPTWSHLIEPGAVRLAASRSGLQTLGDYARATADFRDQYYGLVGVLLEDSSLPAGTPAQDRRFPSLVTSGLIDLATCKWGSVPTRVHKQRWEAPRIDRARLERETDLGPWLASRLVPKILLATQTRVIELIVDEAGVLAPSVPVITVTPIEPSRLWHVAAALASPLACAFAVERHEGTALSAGAIKLSARQAMDLPCPMPGEPWDAAAEAFRGASHSAADRRAKLTECARHMLEASGVRDADRDELLSWWLDRQRA